jgi:hypothetical protein
VQSTRARARWTATKPRFRHLAAYGYGGSYAFVGGAANVTKIYEPPVCPLTRLRLQSGRHEAL